MKKFVSVLLLITILCGIFCTAQAEETPVEKAQRLLTNYTWSQTYYNYLYLNNSKSIYPNFRWVTSINLKQSGFVLTGDGTGKVYLVNTTENLGTSCPGEVSFSADEKTMLIAVVSGDLYGVFIYQRR